MIGCPGRRHQHISASLNGEVCLAINLAINGATRSAGAVTLQYPGHAGEGSAPRHCRWRHSVVPHFVWEDRTEVKTTHPNGDWETGGSTVEKRPHHTAIIEALVGQGIVDVLEQNVPSGDPIHRARLLIVSFLGPKVKKALPNGDLAETTPNYRVSGTVWAFHPQVALPGKKP
ncbi:hypothetical protein GGC47_004511 [Bosea sp. OAE752]|uniref:hypothetical protein n=1 Tax=Bosea sp. OAE752 TaxID=2663873 RepID=UPI003D1C7F57